MSVRDNVRLACGQVAAAAAAQGRVLATADARLAAVGLADMGDRYPRELSAGMQQRVGIARAFALDPRLLLLDEPFSLLDALTRMELQDELMALWEASGKTVIMVTHDIDEALLLADRVAMMTNGPAATLGRILEVPFPRPRRREEILARADYFWLRDSVFDFLEAQAHA
jgi:ABC-type nitrate/sulfonate/bicarbonate transport system ATPase subunit